MQIGGREEDDILHGEVSRGSIGEDVLKLIPEKMARNFKLIGVELRDDILHVAMANPFDIIARDTLKMKTGHDIQRWFSRSREIAEAINRFYQKKTMESTTDEFIDLKQKEVEHETITVPGFEDSEYKGLEVQAAKAPIVAFVNKLLEKAIEKQASDIHIEPHENNMLVRYRVDGILQKGIPQPKQMESAVLTRIKLLGNMDIAEHRLPQDGRFKWSIRGKEVDIRLASMPTIFGEKLVLRLLDKTKLHLDMADLGLEKKETTQFKHILKQPYGMTLVTGPTGSGKTTTLYSALNFINEPGKNIVTIEDPVEYQLEGINQIQIKPHIGLTFASSLRTILRQDPDIIMIGEIRDLETLENAVKASLTGHLVLSTIHTNNAPSVIYRLIHMGLEPYLIVACLNLVVAQRLIRCICTKCKEEIKINPLTKKGLEERLGVSLEGMSFYHGKGCKACNNSGYKGRIGIFEFFMVTAKIKKLILEGMSEREITKVAIDSGMQNLLQSGLEKVKKGVTTIEEVLKVTFVEKVL